MLDNAADGCPIEPAADLVGDRWTLEILRHAMVGVTRFGQFRTELGIADTVLARRLRRLVAAGLLVKKPYQDGRRTRYEYRLTPAGADLFPLMHALIDWGNRHTAGTPSAEPMQVLHSRCGHQLVPGEFCAHCGRHVDRHEISWLRPWASATPFPLVPPVTDTGNP